MTKSILVADTPDSDRRLSAILAGHDVVFARTLGEAQRTLAQQQFDLVLIGVHFDDSRMFDLLRYLRAGGHHAAAGGLRAQPSLRFRGGDLARGPGDRRPRAGLQPVPRPHQYPDDAQGNGEVRKLLEALLTP